MSNTVLTSAAVLTALLYGLLAERKNPPDSLKPLRLLLFVLPFACGGFYTGLAPVVSAVLLFFLYRRSRKSDTLILRLNLTTLALLLTALGFLLTPLWAADRGMAVQGLVRFLPVLLYAAVLLQLTPSERAGLLTPVPLSGAVMVLVSFPLQLIGAFQDSVSVGGRLSGFMEYPNTFALFLLVGLVLLLTKKERRLSDWLCCAVLVCGMVASGSRAVLLLLAVVLIVLCLRRRSLPLAAAVGGGLLLFCALTALGVIPLRFETTSLWARLLYAGDALPVVAKHPFGLGYYGYRAVLGSIRSGYYGVSYVHNGLLQLLLEVGWLPPLLLSAAVIRSFFAKTATLRSRLLLLVLSAHALVDFDFQYLLLWLLLLPLLELSGGKELFIKKGKPALLAASLAALTLSGYIAAGDLLYRLGEPQACLTVTPFHTEAELTLLQSTDDSALCEVLSASILKKNPTCALALSFEANAAFSRGDIGQMMALKEQALACNRYEAAELRSYFDLLLTARQLYLQAGSEDSAEVCRQRLLQIPLLMQQENDRASPLAAKAGISSQLSLSDTYARKLAALTQDGS